MQLDIRKLMGKWSDQDLSGCPVTYICGHCGLTAISSRGMYLSFEAHEVNGDIAGIYICPACRKPTFLFIHRNMMHFHLEREQLPPPPPARQLQHLTGIIESAWEEVLLCHNNSCYAAVAVLCRKVIVEVAIQLGADRETKDSGMKSFKSYAEWLKSNGHIPGYLEPALLVILELGGAAAHRLPEVDQETAGKALALTHILLTQTFELPGQVGERITIPEEGGVIC